MMPNTSVSPAAIRNSITPNCTPFRSCSKPRIRFIASKAQKRARWRRALQAWKAAGSPCHLAVLVVGVLVVVEHLLLDLHLHAVRPAFFRPEQVEVLDRVLIDVPLERPADRIVVRLAH